MGGLGFSEELSLFGILGSFLVSISNLPNRSLLAFGLISRPNRPPKRVNEATPDMVSMLIPSSPKSGINDSGCREAIEDGSISPVPLDLTGTCLKSAIKRGSVGAFECVVDIAAVVVVAVDLSVVVVVVKAYL